MAATLPAAYLLEEAKLGKKSRKTNFMRNEMYVDPLLQQHTSTQKMMLLHQRQLACWRQQQHG